MLETILDTKAVYQEFKAFKSLSVPMNVATSVFMDGRNDNSEIELYFSQNDSFSLLFGKLKLNTEFAKWMVGKVIKADISSFNKIGKTLKKNAYSVEYTDTSPIYFKFIAFDENQEQIEYKFDYIAWEKPKKILDIQKHLVNSIELPDAFLSDEILEVYLDSEKHLSEKSSESEILIELPVAKILALLKNTKNTKSQNIIQFSERMADHHCYVCFTSKNDDLGLELSQVFLTV